MEEQKRILEAVFGESSDEENQLNDFGLNQTRKNPNWERVKEINGLWLCRDFLSPDEQASLLSAIEREGWFTEASHNQGICAHVDLMRFDDGIAIVSLESACVMHFSQVTEQTRLEERKESEKEDSVLKVPVFLSPGSLVLMSGEARYIWKHEINRKPGCQVWNGREIDQKKRSSITLRRLCQT